MCAKRAARAFRRRGKALKFEGGYHGMRDPALMSLAPKRPSNFPRPIPDSAGIPARVQEEVPVAPFNDAEAALALVEAHADELAGVIVEPFQRLLPPLPGFLAALRAATAKHGIPLIFDEVVTGFRFGYGGAQGYYGVTPDLCTLGKIIGGGFPLAAVCGRADIMAHFDRAKAGEEGFLPQIGTLSGNPVAAVAGLVTLEALRRPGAYEGVFALGRRMMAGLTDILARRGVAGHVVGEPVLFDVVFMRDPPRNYRDMLAADAARAAQVNRHLRGAGILKGESKFYLSTAHTEDDVARTLAAFDKALQDIP